MKIQYVNRKFTPGSLAIIDQANMIIEEYSKSGMDLTLRQLYYQFVARDLLANKQSEYKRLSSIISDARLAGLVDWFAIIDRTRNLKGNYHNTDPGDAVQDALRHFMLDRWKNQPYYVEVWIEKEALIGVIAGICREMDLPFFACKGYTSQSEMWGASRRINRKIENGKVPIIIHLGDHDPSGIDMTYDVERRQNVFQCPVLIQRIALNWDQIEEYKPPPNPVKLTDSRSGKYQKKFGNSSWELDALEPKIMKQLIRSTVDRYINKDLWIETVDLELEYKNTLKKVVENWESL
jgi:hypothetical protein